MRSIRTQLLILVFGSVILAFGILAGIMILSYRGLVETNARHEMEHVTDAVAGELNNYLSTVERAAAGLADYLSHKPDHEALKLNGEYAESFYSDLAIRSAKSADITGIAHSVFFRPDPEIYGSTAGMLMIDNGYGEFIRGETTEIPAVSNSDRSSLPWYYEPVNAGRAVWLPPYTDKGMNLYIISYVVPVYVEGRFFGVFGMDIAMKDILKVMESGDYGEGFAFLVGDNGDLIYHRDHPEGIKEILLDEELGAAVDFLTSKRASDHSMSMYRYRGKTCRLMGADLVNNMKLAVSIPNSQVRAPINRMWRDLIFLLILVVIVLSFTGWFINVRIVSPIRELTGAASRISRGEFNTPISYASDNEIGELSRNIRLMSKEMNEYFNYIHAQAYTDAMTGVSNKTAYFDTIKRMDRKIIEHMADFGIVVFDINGLKRVNDNLGHEFGDMLISDAASVMKVVFGSSRVFRVGGDEFTVVLEGVGESEMQLYFNKFDTSLANFNSGYKKYETELAISKGYAIYDREKDCDFQAVFKRADEAMYLDKEKFYSGSNDRRRGR